MPQRKRQRPRQGDRVSWWHVAASAVGLVAANLLLRLGLRRRRPPVIPRERALVVVDVEAEAPRVVDHTPVPPEPRDARVRPVLLSMLAILLFFGGITAAVSALQWWQTGALPSLSPPAGPLDDPPQGLPPPDPRRDVAPRDTLAAVRATEAALLDYGWADEAAGVVRLPIERAMQLLAERGLPVAPGADDRRYADLVPRWPSDASSGREEEVLWP